MTLPAMQAQITKVTQTVAELEQTSVEFANSVTELYGRVVRVMTAAAVPGDSGVHMDIRRAASQQTAAAMEPTMQDRLIWTAQRRKEAATVQLQPREPPLCWIRREIL